MSLMKIDDLFHFEKGILQSSKCTEGEFDFITASSEWKKHNEYTHDCEALVFAAAASGSLGRTHYVNGKFISSDLCFIITAKDPIKLPIDLKFYHMIFNEFKNDIVNSTKAGTSKEAIGMKAFGNYKLPYFAINKQIDTKVQFVNMQDSKVELNVELTHQLNLIKQLRQAFLREAMQGKLVKSNNTKETGQQLLAKIKAEKAKLIADKKLKKEKELAPITEDEIPFEIPKHWVWCRLGEISNIQRGKSPKYSDNGVFKMLNQKCVRWFSINIEHSKAVDEIWFNSIDKELKIKVNDLLVNSTGDGTIGRSGITDIICDNFMFDSHILRVRSFVKIEQKLLCYIINSEYGQSLIESIKGATSTKQTELGVNNLSNFPIPLPPLHEQEQILSKLEELMAFCDGLEHSIKESEGYNEMLLQQVLREALQGEKV